MTEEMVYVLTEEEHIPVTVILLTDGGVRKIEVGYPKEAEKAKLKVEDKEFEIKKSDLYYKKGFLGGKSYYCLLTEKGPLHPTSVPVTSYTFNVVATSKVLRRAVEKMFAKPIEIKKFIFIAIVFIIIGVVGFLLTSGMVKF